MDGGLIARGRASTVHDLGGGRLLRRAPGSDAEREAAARQLAQDLGERAHARMRALLASEGLAVPAP